MKLLDFILIISIIAIYGCLNMINDNRNSSEITVAIQNYQTTIDSLINKNQRLNNGFLELYDDRSMMSIEMNKLIRDNKYLKRITR